MDNIYCIMYILEYNKDMKTLVIVGTHGDEVLKKLNLPKGWDIIVGNPEAVKARKRYTEADLNRVFGVEGDTYEHRRSRELLPILRKYDTVIDVHATTSGNTDAVIVVHDTPITRRYARRIATNYVIMPEMTSSLIAQAKHGLALELGAYDDTRYENVLLRNEDMQDWQAWMVTGTAHKPRKGVAYHKNYDLVSRGDVYYTTEDGEDLVATDDFYTFLWGENSYQTIIGFKMLPVIIK